MTKTTDLTITDDWGVEDEDPTEGIRTAIADAERELHDLGIALLDADFEVRVAAMYALTDAADRLGALSIRLGFAL